MEVYDIHSPIEFDEVIMKNLLVVSQAAAAVTLVISSKKLEIEQVSRLT